MKSNSITIPRALVAASAVAALSFGAVACSDDDDDPSDLDNPVDGVDDQVDSIVDGADDQVDSIVDGADSIVEDIGDTTDE
jgi:hypothetical protein